MDRYEKNGNYENTENYENHESYENHVRPENTDSVDLMVNTLSSSIPNIPLCPDHRGQAYPDAVKFFKTKIVNLFNAI